MSNVWIYSDPHFYHKNIIKYCLRPFSDEFEMNETIISNHNKVVKPDDKVFIAGDFSFCPQDKVLNLVTRLNGKITLIMGNHDRRHSVSWWKDVGFEEVYEYPIIYKGFFIISHEPVFINDTMPYVNLYGHLHQNSVTNKNAFNLCVEVNNYTPVNVEDIFSRFKED